MVINLGIFLEHTNVPYYGYKYRQQCPILGNISDANIIFKAHSKTGANESTKPMLNVTTPLLNGTPWLLLEACSLIFQHTI